jgi:hypothetical protein
MNATRYKVTASKGKITLYFILHKSIQRVLPAEALIKNKPSKPALFVRGCLGLEELWRTGIQTFHYVCPMIFKTLHTAIRHDH